MKYPFILFYRFGKYSEIDSFIKDNKESFNCTIHVIDNSIELNKLYNPNYQILITYGGEEIEYHPHVCPYISNRMGSRWIHFSEIASVDTFNQGVNYCFIHNCTLPREKVRSVFSIFTTCYESYEKILRAYRSVMNQRFIDWEWIVLDDTPDDVHFQFLKKKLTDARVRLYKRSENSGNIGNVKNEAVSLCRGKYVLELDHDDEILPDVLKDAVDLFEKNEDVGFVYMDFTNVYENGENFCYGDLVCKGYGAYYCEKLNGKWVYVYITPNINNVTLSHLTCCPNHPRIWRRDVLMNAGNYSEFLPICDDFEILLRTAAITKMAKICKLGYVQYMNNNNNNFSLIRNAEINRLGPYFISPIFFNKFNITEKMKQVNAYEDEKYIFHHSNVWTRDAKDYTHNYANVVCNPDYEKQYCIIGVNAFLENIGLIQNLYKNEKNDFILLDVCHVSELWRLLDFHNLTRFKCYSYKDNNSEMLINYFKIMYKSNENYDIIVSERSPIESKYVKFNTSVNFRHDVINSLTSKDNSYLEIGVEHGLSFKNVHFLDKTGVDPDPKFETEDKESLKLLTSDDFFEKNDKIFDVIFIDGMHQCEYVLKDFNNSIQCLVENGILFIDDILPISYNEQLKVPNKHYYENGILKYGEPWTGDVWKVMFYIFNHYKESFDFSYFNNENYRGVGMLKIKNKFQIPNNSINEINAYDYNTDFASYVKYFEQM